MKIEWECWAQEEKFTMVYDAELLACGTVDLAQILADRRIFADFMGRVRPDYNRAELRERLTALFAERKGS